MARLKGISVILYDVTQTGVDPFGNPIEEETPITIDNVLVGFPETEEMETALNLYGKRIQYTLGIPKGDTHTWANKKVSWVDAYGTTHTCKTFGAPLTGIEENIPSIIPWHKKVYCANYENNQD